MTKSKIFGLLENEATLLEPISELRYKLPRTLERDLVGQWLTVKGTVANGQDAPHMVDVEVTNVEKAKGKVSRSGTIVADAPNKPIEAQGMSAYLYQENKGRYYLLSAGAPTEPLQGDFSGYIGKNVQVSGALDGKSYILYQVKITAK